MDTAIVILNHAMRLQDNPALAHAAAHHQQVVPVYIADKQHGAAQNWWLHHSLLELSNRLEKLGAPLVIVQGPWLQALIQLKQELNFCAVYWNQRYTPIAIAEAQQLKQYAQQHAFIAKNFHVDLLIKPWSLLNKQGSAYRVFTPFYRAASIHELHQITAQPSFGHGFAGKISVAQLQLLPQKPNWAQGFDQYNTPGEVAANLHLEQFIAERLHQYKDHRDFPAQAVTSNLSAHLHFGELSPRQVLNQIYLAMEQQVHYGFAETFIRQLYWREFCYYLLYHFPQIVQDNFNTKFDHFSWQTDSELLVRWQKGETGYPLVDAGMRQLWQTGQMHNRVRMVVASFLTKDCLIDWREGANWFADTLLDADMANNICGWQWVAGCGADAAPYFRIFNPYTQSKKFDPDGSYIRQWCPELAQLSDKQIHQPQQELLAQLAQAYPAACVDHAQARKTALAKYQQLG